MQQQQRPSKENALKEGVQQRTLGGGEVAAARNDLRRRRALDVMPRCDANAAARASEVIPRFIPRFFLPLLTPPLLNAKVKAPYHHLYGSWPRCLIFQGLPLTGFARGDLSGEREHSQSRSFFFFFGRGN